MELSNISGKTGTIAASLRSLRTGSELNEVQKDLTFAVARFDEALKHLQRCITEDFVKEDELSLEEPSAALEVATLVGKSGFQEGKDSSEGYGSVIKQLDDATNSVAQFVCDRNTWINDLDDPVKKTELDGSLLKFPDVKLWWIASFEKQNPVPWEAFWTALSDHMGIVYGFPLPDDSDIRLDVAMCLKSCFGKIKKIRDPYSDTRKLTWQQSENISIQRKQFRTFYQRFGPWKSLYLKTCTLCDAEGIPFRNFIPSNKREEGRAFMRKEKLTFVVRFSSKSGMLVYQNKLRNVVVTNSPSGFKVPSKGGPRMGADVMEALYEGWNYDQADSEENGAEYWRVMLSELDVLEDEDNPSYGLLSETKRESLDQRRHSDVLRQLDSITQKQLEIQGGQAELKEGLTDIKNRQKKIKAKVDAVHEDVIQFGLDAMTDTKSVMPRLFFMTPVDISQVEEALTLRAKARNLKEKTKKKAGVVKWHVNILCEGNECRILNDKKHYICHPTGEDAHEIELSSEVLEKRIPAIIMGIKIAKLGLGVATGGMNPAGDLVDKIAGLLKIEDRLEGLATDLERLSELHGLTKNITAGEAQDDYHLLHNMIGDQFDEDELRDGKCGTLKLMWNPKEHRTFWVCDRHRENLNGLTRAQKASYQLAGADEQKTIESRSSLRNVNSTLSVHCERGEGLPNVEAFPLVDKSDPYCTIIPYDETDMPLDAKVTQTVDNDLDPEWNEKFEWTHTRKFSKIEILVYDANAYRDDVLMGSCTLKVTYEDKSFFIEEARPLMMEGKPVGKLHCEVVSAF